jgi:hypothetical protein
MDLDRDAVEAIANGEITKRFQRIGIWETTAEEVEVTRANFKSVNDARKLRESKNVSVKKSVRDVATTLGAQFLWFVLLALGAWALQELKK